ncbi:MAG: hypothetical protein MUC92_13095 [Fimbriimonadaceae bacterium]|nr:hypothetical protein [Fimbriimonadaceae bacterium]
MDLIVVIHNGVTSMYFIPGILGGSAQYYVNQQGQVVSKTFGAIVIPVDEMTAFWLTVAGAASGAAIGGVIGSGVGLVGGPFGAGAGAVGGVAIGAWGGLSGAGRMGQMWPTWMGQANQTGFPSQYGNIPYP